MLRRTALLALLPLSLGLLASALPPAQGNAAQEWPREESPLHGHMEAINESVRTIARNRDAGASPEVLAALAQVQTAIVAAKGEVPGPVAELTDDAKKAEELVAFRMQMNDLLRGFLDLEDARLRGDSVAAQAKLKELGALKDAGHERFKPKRGR